MAWQEEQFELITSQLLLNEYDAVWQRPKLRRRIDLQEAERLRLQMRVRATIVTVKTIPPGCRDPKDLPVLATAIDGEADGIVTGDDDLRADDVLRQAMADYGIKLWGVQSFLNTLKHT
jgi:putative PIN family toxin of toxin-antitoxin system